MLSIIIPARNESDNLKDILDYFTKNLNDIEYEVVLINDFSNDDTFDKAKSISLKDKISFNHQFISETKGYLPNDTLGKDKKYVFVGKFEKILFEGYLKLYNIKGSIGFIIYRKR